MSRKGFSGRRIASSRPGSAVCFLHTFSISLWKSRNCWEAVASVTLAVFLHELPCDIARNHSVPLRLAFDFILSRSLQCRCFMLLLLERPSLRPKPSSSNSNNAIQEHTLRCS